MRSWRKRHVMGSDRAGAGLLALAPGCASSDVRGEPHGSPRRPRPIDVARWSGRQSTNQNTITVLRARPRELAEAPRDVRRPLARHARRTRSARFSRASSRPCPPSEPQRPGAARGSSAKPSGVRQGSARRPVPPTRPSRGRRPDGIPGSAWTPRAPKRSTRRPERPGGRPWPGGLAGGSPGAAGVEPIGIR